MSLTRSPSLSLSKSDDEKGVQISWPEFKKLGSSSFVISSQVRREVDDVAVVLVDVAKLSWLEAEQLQSARIFITFHTRSLARSLRRATTSQVIAHSAQLG